MAINKLEFAKVFMSALDRQMLEKATSGWMETNAGQVIYNGGNEVKVPKIVMSGLAAYDREEGFVRGPVTYSYQTKLLTQDRGRTFQLDAMDVDETNFGTAAGNVLGEFQRTKVIPEVDAYRYSVIADTAITANRYTEYTPKVSDIVDKLMEDITNIKDTVGNESEIIVTISTPVASILSRAQQMPKWIDVTNFSQGGVNMQVKTFDNCPIINVPSSRMKTKYKFFDGISDGEEDGGFLVDDDAKNINWIITSKTAPIAVSKTDVTRIFDPMTNQKANAWKLDYRKYHDLWILDNAIDGIWLNYEK